MVTKSLLDTDILSEILRAHNANVVAQAQAYKAVHGQLTLSVITVMEIVKGMHKMGRTQALNRFLQGIQSSEVLPFDQPSAEIAGRIYGDLESAGQARRPCRCDDRRHCSPSQPDPCKQATPAIINTSSR